MASKLSVHDLVPNDPARLLVDAGCPVVKSVGNAGLLLEAMTINPSVVCIMRFENPVTTAESLRSRFPIDAKGAANAWLTTYVEQLEANPHLRDSRVYIEGCNEPVFKKPNPNGGDDLDDLGGMTWYGLFEKARVEALAAMGYQSCIGNFGTGYPHIAIDDVRWWDQFAPAVRAAIAHKGILGFHAYSNSDLTSDPSNILRHELIHRLFLVPRGLEIPMVATEFGRLYWKKNVEENEYARQLIAIDSRLQTAPYLLGATVFTFGSTLGWDDFEINRTIAQKLSDHIRASKTVPPPPPPPPPPPTPEPQPPIKFAVGTRVKITSRNDTRALFVRNNQTNGVIGSPRGTHLAGDVGTVKGSPFFATLGPSKIAWVEVQFDSQPSGFVSQNYLDPHTSFPPPPPIGENLLFNPDMFSAGHHSLPGRQNVRVGDGWELQMHEGWEPRLPGMTTDPQDRLEEKGFWLAIESQYRSRGDVPDTETLPQHEWDLYLGPNPIVYHLFKRWGIQWWTLSQTLDLAPGNYVWGLKLFPNVYFRSFEFVTNEPVAAEWKLDIDGQSEVAFDNGGTPPLGQDGDRIFFGFWRDLSRTFTHPGGPCTVKFTYRARWGVDSVEAMLKDAFLRRI